jgi:acetyl-CoA C-acetyltransferase
MTRTVIVSGVRTPVGKFGSTLRSCSAVDLGAAAIREAIARAGVPPSEIDQVVMGHVLQAGAGQATSTTSASRV